MNFTTHGTRFTVVQADITTQHVDAIVNAAQPQLTGGGGVDGAIHRVAGPSLLEACVALVKERGPLATGHAVVTAAGNLPAKWVVHTVGPIWRDGMRGENVKLERAYTNSLEVAVAAGARSIAFPAISTGAYGFPVDAAALIALSTVFRFVMENPGKLDEVRFIVFSDEDRAVYAGRFDEVVRTQIGTGSGAHGG